jgi:hypothetical protein
LPTLGVIRSWDLDVLLDSMKRTERRGLAVMAVTDQNR